MKRGGIKVWVLTGDKVGTAKMIGLATGLLEPAMEKHEIRYEPDKQKVVDESKANSMNRGQISESNN